MKLISLEDTHEQSWQRYSQIFISNPHICGLTTQIMSGNMLKEKNLQEQQPDKVFHIFKTITSHKPMRNFFPFPWFLLFVPFPVSKV